MMKTIYATSFRIFKNFAIFCPHLFSNIRGRVCTGSFSSFCGNVELSKHFFAKLLWLEQILTVSLELSDEVLALGAARISKAVVEEVLINLVRNLLDPFLVSKHFNYF